MLNFWQIQFPIFQLDKRHHIQRLDNMLVVELSDGSYRVIDNLNFEDSTLAMRRLRHAANSGDLLHYPLFKLNKPVYSIVDMLHSECSRFIDSSGRIINWTKEKFYRLKTYKIKHFTQVEDGYVLTLQGLHCRFFINRAPHVDEKFARVLRVGRGYLLYELTSECVKDSRLKL